MERQTGYVTRLELVESQDKLKTDIMRQINKTHDDIDKVDDKVDQLRDIVLPLVESSKQTAENTKVIAASLTDFVKTQQETNTKLQEKQNNQELAIQGLHNVTGAISTKKKANAGIIIAVIGGISTIVGGIIAMAPKLFQVFGG